VICAKGVSHLVRQRRTTPCAPKAYHTGSWVCQRKKINKGKQESYEGLLVTARSSVFCFPCRWDVAEMVLWGGCINVGCLEGIFKKNL